MRWFVRTFRTISGFNSQLKVMVILPAVLMVLLIQAQAAGNLKVVASVKPIHSLVAAVMEGVSMPVQLMPDGQSPHDFQLRPSHARTIQSADIIFWIGPGLESFLPVAITAMGANMESVRLIDTPGLAFPDEHDDDEHKDAKHAAEKDDEHSHDDVHQHEDHDDHDDGDEHSSTNKVGEKKDEHHHEHDDDEHAHEDHHIWLDPENASLMVGEIEKALSKADPDNASSYKSNAIAFQKQLKSLTSDIEELLVPVKGRGYVVYHQAYRHFEHRFGLSSLGSILGHEEVAPGARTIRELGGLISKGKVRCVFTEPQYDKKLALMVVGDSEVKLAELDPIAQDVEQGPKHYLVLLRNLATTMKTCLGQTN